jgi:hypothetical protein
MQNFKVEQKILNTIRAYIYFSLNSQSTCNFRSYIDLMGDIRVLEEGK